MNRYWLVTWTCYGTWLPGDERGFVGFHEDGAGERAIHNEFGTPFDADVPRLAQYSRSIMKGDPVHLGIREAEALIAQFQETCAVRGWELQAASVMYNHAHVVVGVPGDPDPQSILKTLKSWATRALKRIRPLPPNGDFWTANGSRRKQGSQTKLRECVVYVVRQQPNPLAVWFHPKWQEAIDEFDRTMQRMKDA